MKKKTIKLAALFLAAFVTMASVPCIGTAKAHAAATASVKKKIAAQKKRTTKIKKITALKNTITVKVKKKSAAGGYQLRYSVKKGMKNAVKVNMKKNAAKTIRGLKYNTTYYVQVRTYKKIAGKRRYSRWSAKVSIRTGKKADTAPDSSAGSADGSEDGWGGSSSDNVSGSGSNSNTIKLSEEVFKHLDELYNATDVTDICVLDPDTHGITEDEDGLKSRYTYTSEGGYSHDVYIPIVDCPICYPEDESDTLRGLAKDDESFLFVTAIQHSYYFCAHCGEVVDNDLSTPGALLYSISKEYAASSWAPCVSDGTTGWNYFVHKVITQYTRHKNLSSMEAMQAVGLW